MDDGENNSGNNVEITDKVRARLGFYRISISFSDHLARILGFEANTKYFLTGERSAILAPKSIKCDRAVQYLYINSDLNQLERFGSQYSSVIDIVPGAGFSKKVNTTLYKKLRPFTEITSIAVIITDQDGEPIYWPEDVNVVAIFHIRGLI